MNNRLKAWIGFNDGNCNEDTQMLIDDIKQIKKIALDNQERYSGALARIAELEKKLAEAMELEELTVELVAIVVRYNTNFLYYKSELSGSWHEIYNESKTVIERYRYREEG